MGKKLSTRTNFLILADVASVFGGLLIALYLRLDVAGVYDQLQEQNGWLKILLATSVCISCIYLHDLYDYQVIGNRYETPLRIIQAVGVWWVLLAAVYYLVPAFEIGRGTALYAIVITLATLLAVRIGVTFVLQHPNVGERILLVGGGGEVGDTIEAATSRQLAGYRVVGFLGEASANGHAGPAGVQQLGTINDLESVVESERIDRIVVGVRQRRGVFPADALLRLRLNGDVFIDECATFYERVSGRVHLDMVRPSWLIFSEHARNTQVKSAVRDLFHRLLALIGLVFSLPVAVLTAVLIKLESPGPVFYKQERVGKNDRKFEVIKFRSMKVDAEADGDPVWAAANDGRVTAVGKVIRKIRVDEIPQFWNIIKGEMKFVGPRPERPHFVKQLAQEIPFYEYRHLVAPGLTGWAQVKYPYGASVEDARRKLEYDLYYIKNQTLVLDLLIVLQTVKIILLGRGGR